MGASPKRVVDEPKRHAKGIAQTITALNSHGTGFAQGVRDVEVGELRAPVDVRLEVLDDEGMVQIVICVV